MSPGMSETVLERPLVRQYLRSLDAACAALPRAQAQELHELIAAHLEETLPPDASMPEVLAELNRLGPAHSLAATAAGPGQFSAMRRLGNRARRVRWWVWTAIAVLVLALGTGAGYLISVNTAAPLIASGGIGWLYPADQARAVETSADDVTQTTVPYRFGQRQGILVGLVNDSDWTQQIVGVGPGWAFGSLPGTSQASVESAPHFTEAGGEVLGTSYTFPGDIPPHSARIVRVYWTSDECMAAHEGNIIDSISLLVRVGGITRTENIPLEEAFELAGPAHSIIRDCQ
jgi:hypothetical protein